MAGAAAARVDALRERDRLAGATMRDAHASARQSELEMLQSQRRLEASDAAEERRLRGLGLQGVLPVERRARPSVDLSAFGLISVSRIFDDVAAANAPPRRPPFATPAPAPSPPTLRAPEPAPGYALITKAAAKRASKAIARREAREARSQLPPTAGEVRRRVAL